MNIFHKSLTLFILDFGFETALLLDISNGPRMKEGFEFEI